MLLQGRITAQQIARVNAVLGSLVHGYGGRYALLALALVLLAIA